MKKGLTIKEQITHLKENKNIIFDDEQKAEEYLLKYSYYDVINPLKVFFSSGIEDGKHKYKNKTQWQDIITLHQRIKTLEQGILNEVLNFELELKSAFCNWLSAEIKNNSFCDFNSFLNSLYILERETHIESRLEVDGDSFRKSFKNNYTKYGYNSDDYNQYWWLTIMSLSFGKFIRIINSRTTLTKTPVLWEVQAYNNTTTTTTPTFIEVLRKKVKKAKKLNLKTINILRNSLCHQTNILIFLNQPLQDCKICNQSSFQERRKAVIVFAELSKQELSENGIIRQFKSLKNNNNNPKNCL